MKILFIILSLFANFICLAQTTFLPMPNGFCTNVPSSPSFVVNGSTTSTNGYVHTPKGNLHVLIVFIEPLNYTLPPNYLGNPADPINGWPVGGIPNWASGESNLLIDKNIIDIGTNKNLSLFYQEMSHGQFLLTGEVFPELIPAATGEASEAVAYINTNYPLYDWSRFDNRTNHPNYNSDNSTSPGDGIIDYVVFMKRRGGSFNGYSSTDVSNSTTLGGYGLDDGHTAEFCYNSANHHQIFFKHEFAHNLYNSAHYLGANSCSDGEYYYESLGWGLMAAWHQQFDVANAWESWWLGWISPQDVTATGTYQIDDYVTNGDAIRIPVPHTNGEYLWIENHQKIDAYNYDDKPFYGSNSGLPNAEDIDPGLYMYITKHFDDRTDPSLMSGNNSLSATNFIKVLNGEGNYDIISDQLGTFAVTGAGNWDCFYKGEENPIAGQNSYTRIKFNEDGDNPLQVPYHDGNQGCSGDESGEFWAENINGVRTATYSRTGRHNQAFTVGMEIGMSGKVPVTNYPVFDPAPLVDKLEPFVMNGLSIKITNYNSTTGKYTLDVNFSDYQVRNDKRWCGDIELRPNPTPSLPCLEVTSGTTLRVDKSGTPNRKNELTPLSLNFINPTVLNCTANSFVNLQSNSTMTVENNSTLKLSSNSVMEINSGALLHIKTGSKLILEGNASINVLNGGRILIEDDASFDYYPNAQLLLSGNTSVCEIKGILNIQSNATFTFTSNNLQRGYLLFSNTSLFPSRNIIGGMNSSINLIGSSTNRKILEIAQETFYGPPTLVNFNISDGNVVFHPNSRLQADGLSTAINFTNVRFTSNTPGLNNGHRGVHLYGQSNVTINGCVFEFGRYGIFSYMTYGGSPLNVIGSIFRHNNYGIRAYDKGLNLVACNFFNNDFGVFGGQMAYPSEFIEGMVGGGVSNRNTTGIRWYGYSTPVLTLNNPYVNTNRTGVDVQSCPLKVKCGSISYNEAEGILIKAGANLFMNDQVAVPNGANVSVFNNGYSIRAVNAENLWLQKGYNVLTPSTMNNERTAFGTLFYPSLTIDAEANQWSSTGPLAASDFHLFNSSGANYNINGNVPQATIPLCGQAIPPCPNPPCPNQSPLENCPACELINTDDFYFTKLNIATLAAIEMLNSSASGKYTEAINLFSQILNENYNNPDDKEKYLLSLSYIKMMEALGNAYKYGEIFCSENAIPAIVEEVINVQDKLIDIAINNNDYNYRFKYSMDKAQTLRLACKRMECINLLNDIRMWSDGQDDNNAVDLFICEVSIEIQVVNGTIKLEEIEAEMANCNQSNERVRNEPNPILVMAPTEILQVNIFNKTLLKVIDIKTNAENANLIFYNSIGEIITEENINYDFTIETASLSKGLYLMKITDLNTKEISTTKVIIN